MHLVRCFTVSPPAISNFFGGFVVFLFCCVFVWLGVWLFGFVVFPHGFEVTTVVCEVVCEVEGPSELSWRARHGRKKKCKQLMWTASMREIRRSQGRKKENLVQSNQAPSLVFLRFFVAFHGVEIFQVLLRSPLC